MTYGIFSLTQEDNTANTTVEESNVIEEIAAEEAYYEMLSVESDINKDVIAMKQAEAVVCSVESSCEHKKHLLANPENINANCVDIAMESLETTAMLLGTSVVSLESDGTPVERMELSLEKEKSFLTKVIDSIKAIFRKITNSVKKLYAKMIVSMDGTVKTATKLKKHIQKNLKDSDGKDTFTDKESEYLKKHTYIKDTIIKNKNKVFVNGAMNVVNSVNDMVTMDENSNDVIAKLESEHGEGPELEKLILDELFKLQTKKAKYFKKFKATNANDLEELFGFDIPDAKNGFVTPYITSYSVNKVRVVYTYTAEADGVDGEDIDYIKIATINVTNPDIADGKVSVMSIKDMETMLDELIVKGKALPKLEKNSSKAIANANKALDKEAKKASMGNKLNYVVNKLKAGNLTMLRDMTVTTLLNAVMDELKLCKADLYTVKRHAGMYKTGSM